MALNVKEIVHRLGQCPGILAVLPDSCEVERSLDNLRVALELVGVETVRDPVQRPHPRFCNLDHHFRRCFAVGLIRVTPLFCLFVLIVFHRRQHVPGGTSIFQRKLRVIAGAFRVEAYRAVIMGDPARAVEHTGMENLPQIIALFCCPGKAQE